jgi:hypothetical protein
MSEMYEESESQQIIDLTNEVQRLQRKIDRIIDSLHEINLSSHTNLQSVINLEKTRGKGKGLKTKLRRSLLERISREIEEKIEVYEKKLPQFDIFVTQYSLYVIDSENFHNLLRED